MVDCANFSINKAWLDLLEEERREMGKMTAALAMSYNSGRSSYYIIDERAMKLFITLLDEAYR